MTGRTAHSRDSSTASPRRATPALSIVMGLARSWPAGDFSRACRRSDWLRVTSDMAACGPAVDAVAVRGGSDRHMTSVPGLA